MEAKMNVHTIIEGALALLLALSELLARVKRVKANSVSQFLGNLLASSEEKPAEKPAAPVRPPPSA